MNNAFIIGRYLIFQADKRASVVVSSLFLFNLEESIESRVVKQKEEICRKTRWNFIIFLRLVGWVKKR